MRENLFKGKRTDNGEWVKGFYVVLGGENHCIFTGRLDITRGSIGYEYFKVDPETVGQYTDLIDKNGNKIFEGDILQCKEKTRFFAKIPYVVEYVGEIASYVVRASTTQRSLPCMNTGTMKVFTVIGNIHDNPELLKEESNARNFIQREKNL